MPTTENRSPARVEQKAQPWKSVWPPTGPVQPVVRLAAPGVKGAMVNAMSSEAGDIWRIDGKEALVGGESKDK